MAISLRKKIARFFHIQWFYHNVFYSSFEKRMPTTIAMRKEYFSFTKLANQITQMFRAYRPTCKTCWLHNINLVQMLKLVKYFWTKMQNLYGILDEIGDFGRMENETLDSMFIQSLPIVMVSGIASHWSVWSACSCQLIVPCLHLSDSELGLFCVIVLYICPDCFPVIVSAQFAYRATHLSNHSQLKFI